MILLNRWGTPHDCITAPNPTVPIRPAESDSDASEAVTPFNNYLPTPASDSVAIPLPARHFEATAAVDECRETVERYANPDCAGEQRADFASPPNDMRTQIKRVSNVPSLPAVRPCATFSC